jgi:hypothetical protein
VMEENHNYSEVIGASAAPYINSLAESGALFTDSHAIEHPSQPNYLDLFSGSNQGITDDSCPHSFSTANLGASLIKAGLTFGGYSEDLPSIGYTGCNSGSYARRHSPWVNFTNVPAASSLPFTSWPSDFTRLPTLSFVIPNVKDDMHDSGTIPQADTWLKDHLESYRQWALGHNSLLVVTWDEDDYQPENHVVTIFYGPMVRPGRYGETINHFNLLRTLEDMYGLPAAGKSANAAAITDVWDDTTPPPPVSFHRGDPNGDGRLDLTDAVFLLRYLVLGGPSPSCMEAADSDNNGTVDLSDAVILLSFLFSSGPPPAAPGPTGLPCGLDPDARGSPHDLGCQSYQSCAR